MPRVAPRSAPSRSSDRPRCTQGHRCTADTERNESRSCSRAAQPTSDSPLFPARHRRCRPNGSLGQRVIACEFLSRAPPPLSPTRAPDLRTHDGSIGGAGRQLCPTQLGCGGGLGWVLSHPLPMERRRPTHRQMNSLGGPNPWLAEAGARASDTPRGAPWPGRRLRSSIRQRGLWQGGAAGTVPSSYLPSALLSPASILSVAFSCLDGNTRVWTRG